jgi:phosphoenolpyruvate synthase/pyruvate phosphate dikinase
VSARDFYAGEVLVVDMTDPDWEPIMKRPARSSPTVAAACHAAIIARKLGIPAVVGTGSATAVSGDGREVLTYQHALRAPPPSSARSASTTLRVLGLRARVALKT